MFMQLEKFKGMLNQKGIDLAIIHNTDKNFAYFNGSNEFNAVLCITPKKEFILATKLDIKTAKVTSNIKNIYEIKKSIHYSIKSHAGKYDVIGINKDNITLNRYKQLKKEFKKSKFVDISNELSNLRAEKTAVEINIMKKAAAITDKILTSISKQLSSNKSELDIAAMIKKEMQKYGCSESFPTIVATSRNSSDIHHMPTNKKLKGFTIIDLGVNYKGYCSDMTRTFYLGNPSKREMHDYNNILNIINSMKTTADIRNVKLPKNQYHALGHSIGIEVHEKPTVTNKARIINNMIIAIEPACYNNRYGIRIETMFLVKNNKLINLSRFPKDLRIIKN